MYEISFDGPGVAFRTLSANRFVKIFAEKLNQFFPESSTELSCFLQTYRDRSYEYLIVQWCDAYGHTFEYTFRGTGYGYDYNIDSEGCYRIESGDTMNAGDLCEALSYVDQIHKIIRELRPGEGQISLQLRPTMYSGGEESMPI